MKKKKPPVGGFFVKYSVGKMLFLFVVSNSSSFRLIKKLKHNEKSNCFYSFINKFWLF